jgi:hypothetical protein
MAYERKDHLKLWLRPSSIVAMPTHPFLSQLLAAESVQRRFPIRTARG